MISYTIVKNNHIKFKENNQKIKWQKSDVDN
jgi:hypothetical protein